MNERKLWLAVRAWLRRWVDRRRDRSSTPPPEPLPAQGRTHLRAGTTGHAATSIQIPGRLHNGGVTAGGRRAGVTRHGSARVPVRRYEPETDPWSVLVWAHGGSFTRGTLDWPEADQVARAYAAHGVLVYSVDYVLVSETVRAPAPVHDVAAVLRWAQTADSEWAHLPVIVGGASAGAHLAVLAALECEPGAPPNALLLVYPTLHRVQRTDPRLAERMNGVPQQRRFPADRIAAMYADFLGAATPDAAHEGAEAAALAAGARVAGELEATELGRLPAVVLVHADRDDLRASGEQFGEQMRSAGVPVCEWIQIDTLHGYMNRPDASIRATQDFAETIQRSVAALRHGTASHSGNERKTPGRRSA